MSDIVFYPLSVLVVILLSLTIFLYLKKQELAKGLVQAELVKFLLLDRIEKMSEEIQTLETQQSDGFLRFISESRDWAFDYIEKVQSAIADFNSAMESSDVVKIEEARIRLSEFLPETNPDVVN